MIGLSSEAACAAVIIYYWWRLWVRERAAGEYKQLTHASRDLPAAALERISSNATHTSPRVSSFSQCVPLKKPVMVWTEVERQRAGVHVDTKLS